MNKKYFSLTNVHTVFFLAALISLPMLFQYLPTHDCATRYSPMAEAFAASDFNMAFHSRFLPLYPILTGSVCFLLKCSGYFACKLVCWLLFSFSIYPIYYIAIFVSNKKRIALTASYFFIFCYLLIKFIGGGTRANLKSFLIILIAWAFIGSWKYNKFKYLLWCSVFAALITLTRGDCALYAIFVLGTLIIKQMFSTKTKFIYKPIIAGILFLTIISPWLYFQYNNIGYPVPETRHGMILNKISEKIPAIKLLHNKNSKYDIATGEENPLNLINNVHTDSKVSQNQITIKKISTGYKSQDTPYQTFIKVIKSFFPFYLIFVVIGIIVKVRGKSWNKFDTILASMFVVHILFILLQLYIANNTLYGSQRYIQTTIPLYLVWGAIGFLYLYENLKDLWKGRFKYIIFIACSVAIIILCQQGYKKILRENITKMEETKDLRKISKIISAQNLPHISGKKTALKCNFNVSPIILTEENAIGYYSKCKVISLDYAQQHAEATNKLIADGVINFIVIRRKYTKHFPTLSNKSKTKELYKGIGYTLWMTNR